MFLILNLEILMLLRNIKKTSNRPSVHWLYINKLNVIYCMYAVS